MEMPTALYRVQLAPDFDFGSAAHIVKFLSALGISHMYASPVFKPVDGSRHGYDVVDPNALNPELGSQADFETLAATLAENGMGLLQDIVPNHMAFSRQNAMLMDVLENGAYSAFCPQFDIDWHHFDENLSGRVLAPFLHDRLETCLKADEIRLCWNGEGLAIAFPGGSLPLSLETYMDVLDGSPQRETWEENMGHPSFNLLTDIMDRLNIISIETDPAERKLQTEAVKQELQLLYEEKAPAKQLIDKKIDTINSRRDNGGRPFLLENLLARQMFRLCYWKTACHEINYRRFFDINELIGVCQENPGVFTNTHALLGKLVKKGTISGLRIDHVDGMADPAAYLEALAGYTGKIYTVVEKILSNSEGLPENWPVQGTTGYEFSAEVDGLFVKQQNSDAFTALYADFTGHTDTFAYTVYQSKHHLIETQFAGDLENLAHCFKRLAARKCPGRDMTLKNLREALRETVCWFPVYRTYLSGQPPADTDIRHIGAALGAGMMRKPSLDCEFEFIRSVLLKKQAAISAETDAEVQALCRTIIKKFQQLCPPLSAKGCEDTALYVYTPLLSLNEVGSSPARFGISRGRFHAFITERQSTWPHAVNTTTTHDSKRGEDVRARISVLSEIPVEWRRMVEEWHGINFGTGTASAGNGAIDPHMEYFLYQTLVGAWPADEQPDTAFVRRIRTCMVKSAREAKIHTSWINPVHYYERVLEKFIERILAGPADNPFLDSFIPFSRTIAFFGLFNTLSRTLVKITVPGVPDFYQGTEFFDLNLVDPDNRRPVNYRSREETLYDLIAAAPEEIHRYLDKWPDGKVKFYLTQKALALRNRNRRLFEKGAYIPLETGGPFKRHILAFARKKENTWCVTAVPRFLTGMVNENEMPLGDDIWRDTTVFLPPEAPSVWQNALTGDPLATEKAALPAGKLFARFPAALIIDEDTITLNR